MFEWSVHHPTRYPGLCYCFIVSILISTFWYSCAKDTPFEIILFLLLAVIFSPSIEFIEDFPHLCIDAFTPHLFICGPPNTPTLVLINVFVFNTLEKARTLAQALLRSW
ncbi:MAG: hypothetical protein QGI45_05595 [Myxococcota bacterium]|jgi:hypothetical protein|nr:hypothetical protein [Myxococcota bacterium]